MEGLGDHQPISRAQYAFYALFLGWLLIPGI
jgi:hypothetical protein